MIAATAPGPESETGNHRTVSDEMGSYGEKHAASRIERASVSDRSPPCESRLDEDLCHPREKVDRLVSR